MNTLLCLGLWIWFSFGVVSGIICGSCTVRPTGQPCRFQKAPCNLFPGMSCYRRTVFYGLTPLYTKKGCMSDCKNISPERKKYGMSEEVMCCSDRDFCNR